MNVGVYLQNGDGIRKWDVPVFLFDLVFIKPVAEGAEREAKEFGGFGFVMAAQFKGLVDETFFQVGDGFLQIDTLLCEVNICSSACCCRPGQ